MEKFRDRQFHGEMRSVPLPFNGKLSIKWLKLNFSVQITLCLKIAKIPCTVLVRNSLEIESINFYNKDGKTKVWRRKGRTLDLYINILLILISGDLYSNIILIMFFVKLLSFLDHWCNCKIPFPESSNTVLFSEIRVISPHRKTLAWW